MLTTPPSGTTICICSASIFSDRDRLPCARKPDLIRTNFRRFHEEDHPDFNPSAAQRCCAGDAPTAAGSSAWKGAAPPVQIDTTPPTEDFKPSALNAIVNGRLSQYPEVNSQRRVRTRLRAPTAQTVQLDIGGVKYPMVKGDDGFWVGVSNAQDEDSLLPAQC